MGNVRSVQCALARLGCDAEISSDHSKITNANALILPGVGAFGMAMENLRTRNLVDVLNESVVSRKTPVLGICLGMQLFAETSSELGTFKGLGWIPGHVNLINTGKENLSLPHVGWNNIQQSGDPQFFARIGEGAHFYFDHSYEFDTESSYVACTTRYGKSLVAGVRRGSIWGTQFHPEKSQTAGLKLLRNYLNFVQRENKC
jgi:glutamine amidotransferase